jgi:hypothetical protein
MRGIYLHLKLNLHLYVLNYEIVKDSLLTSHIGYFCTIVSLEISFLFYLKKKKKNSFTWLGTPLSNRCRTPCFFRAVYQRPQRPYWLPLGGLHCPLLAPGLPPLAPPRGGPPWCPDPRAGPDPRPEPRPLWDGGS